MSPVDGVNGNSDENNPWDILNLVIKTEQISKDGRYIHVEFTPEQIQAFCKALDLESLDIQKADFNLVEASKNRFSLTGRLKFGVEQKCIVTLEPVSSEFSEKIEARFWPEDAVSRYISSRPEIEEDPFENEPEAIEGDQINLGRFIYETLATLIDPYPRKADAEFNWKDDTQKDESDELLADKPFAALKILKKNGTEEG